MGKFERKFGKYALHNLSLYLIICYAFGYIISLVNSDFLWYLTLNPYWILKGQVWRIVTWIIIPPSGDNLFFVLIMLYVYYSLGTTLERTWGTFHYNVYLFAGMLFTVLGSFGMYLYLEIVNNWQYTETLNVLNNLAGSGTVNTATAIFLMFSTYYVNMSIFLAFAATYPEMQMLLLFIIPIKVKWLGIIYALVIVYDMIQGGLAHYFVVGASLLNFIIFFITTRKRLHRGSNRFASRTKTQNAYRQKMEQEKVKRPNVTRHKCAVCGRTEETNPELEFRFCSRCEGNYEYCQDHLFTHEHVRSH